MAVGYALENITKKELANGIKTKHGNHIQGQSRPRPNPNMNKDTIAYDLTDHEIENSYLADLAKEAGYASLKAHLNDSRGWKMTVGEIETDLKEQINTPAE